MDRNHIINLEVPDLRPGDHVEIINFTPAPVTHDRLHIKVGNEH